MRTESTCITTRVTQGTTLVWSEDLTVSNKLSTFPFVSLPYVTKYLPKVKTKDILKNDV